MIDSPADLTQMLQDWRGGDKSALERLMPIVYNEMRRRNPNQTLQTTALVHEAYMRLIDRQDLDWQNRAHFFAVAAKMMRGILVNYSIANSTEKRGGANIKLSLDEAIETPDNPNCQEFDILALNDALKKLEAADERKSQIVELRFFAGLGNEEIAEALGVSVPTVKREWKLTKAWLRYEMGK
jgi:RNA polymerase sigma factor (TIGR02999 family)